MTAGLVLIIAGLVIIYWATGMGNPSTSTFTPVPGNPPNPTPGAGSVGSW